MLRRRAIIIAVFTIVGSWYGMMAMHEAGHVIHARMTGGVVSEVSFTLTGFSRTDLSHNPHPLAVAWGGAIWGTLIPLVLFGIASIGKLRVTKLLQFFAGFCLIANGCYLGIGEFDNAGDAGDLLRHGAQRWQLIAFGLVTAPLGLYLWHRLGPRFGLQTGEDTIRSD